MYQNGIEENCFSGGNEKNIFFNQFFRRHKKLKNGHFWPPLHISKLNFHVLAVDSKNFYEFTNFSRRNSENDFKQIEDIPHDKIGSFQKN